jgi:hypothetical protein
LLEPLGQALCRLRIKLRDVLVDPGDVPLSRGGPDYPRSHGGGDQCPAANSSSQRPTSSCGVPPPAAISASASASARSRSARSKGSRISEGTGGGCWGLRLHHAVTMARIAESCTCGQGQAPPAPSACAWRRGLTRPYVHTFVRLYVCIHRRLRVRRVLPLPNNATAVLAPRKRASTPPSVASLPAGGSPENPSSPPLARGSHARGMVGTKKAVFCSAEVEQRKHEISWDRAGQRGIG